MILPGFGNIPNNQLQCYNLLGQEIECAALDQNFVAAGVYPVRRRDCEPLEGENNIEDPCGALNMAFVVEHNSGPEHPGKKAWGFPGEVIHKSIEDNPYLSYVRYLEYAIIGILLFFIFKSILK